MLHSHGLVTCCYRQVEPSYHRPWAYLKAARRLANDLRRHHVRIVHCADILAAHYTALAGFLAGAYVVCHVRCEHSSISARDRTFLMPVKKFVFVSQDTWNKFGMKVERSRGRILYDGFSGAWRGYCGMSCHSPGTLRSARGRLRHRDGFASASVQGFRNPDRGRPHSDQTISELPHFDRRRLHERAGPPGALFVPADALTRIGDCRTISSLRDSKQTWSVFSQPSTFSPCLPTERASRWPLSRPCTTPSP